MTAKATPELEDAYARLATAQAANPGSPAETGHLTKQSLAAHHFVDAVGDLVRFDHARSVWFEWREQRWHEDRNGAVQRLWMRVLSRRYQEALSASDGEMRERQVAAVQTAGATDNAIAAGLHIASNLEPIALRGDEWDPDPWLLGCDNGVIDLRTGELREGRPEDLITRSTHHVYDPAADCPRWDRSLLEVFGGDLELAAWFRRLIGASLVGNSKEIVAIHYGAGNNGKSVCFRTLQRVAGDYAISVAVETLVAPRRDAGAPTPDLMRLRGARLAFTSEPDNNAEMKGGTLKRLASIDRLAGRELHGRHQEWDPTHIVHLATNHLPEIDDPSPGLWRRIVVLPWQVGFRKPGQSGDGPVEDPGLAAALAAETQGILAWCVRGAVEYAAFGLYPLPAAVVSETAIYRTEEDVLGEFVKDRLARAEDDRVTTSAQIHASYLSWAEEVGIPKFERLNSRRFGRRFADRRPHLGWPVERTSSNGSAAYRGLRFVATRAADQDHGEGDGGFGEAFATSSYTTKESEKKGKAASKSTKASASEATRPIDWDEDVAERATDDDAETVAP